MCKAFHKTTTGTMNNADVLYLFTPDFYFIGIHFVDILARKDHINRLGC